MEKSHLETVNDNILFYIIKLVINDYSVDEIVKDNELIEDSSFRDSCDDAAKVVGLDLSFLDINYIISTVKLNQNLDFSTKKPTSILNRPKAKLYKFDVDEFRTEYVRTTYVNKITSYSPDIILSTINAKEYDGSLEWWDGYELEADYYDGETTDVKVDTSSIEEVD